MPEYKYAKLIRPLRGFEEASTASQVQGFVQSGTYLVVEIKKNHPNADTDYACIIVPALGDEETWICTRWKDKTYASVETKSVDAAPTLNFEADPLCIEEKALTGLLPDFYDFIYDFDQGRYPFPLTGFKAPLSPPNTNNCCTFVEALIVKAWENSKTGFSWSMENHKQMMIFSADDYYSPITCLVDEELAEPVSDNDQSPHPWSVIQGWRKQWTSGHTFIILDHHTETDKVLTLESNTAYKLNGVGYRMIGNLKQFPAPDQNWWGNDQLWTWERFKSVYKFRKQCILKVKSKSWI